MAKKTPTAPTTNAKAPKVAKTSPSARFVCNLIPSRETEKDWTFTDSVEAGALAAPAALPSSVDLREAWWSINNQESTGSCVGWATGDGVLRRTFVAAGRLAQTQLLSPRYLWMASKETDTITARPETFIEEAGTTLKGAVDVARKYGVALMEDLPFHISTTMYAGRENTFYARCAQLRIASYFNLHKNMANWKAWLAGNGPILAGLQVDASWDAAAATQGRIENFQAGTVRGGHAVCIVGYRADGWFIVRNSWGTAWGDGGFGYLDPEYIADGFFDESYGVTL
jgi:hypothetical protein